MRRALPVRHYSYTGKSDLALQERSSYYSQESFALNIAGLMDLSHLTRVESRDICHTAWIDLHTEVTEVYPK